MKIITNILNRRQNEGIQRPVITVPSGCYESTITITPFFMERKQRRCLSKEKWEGENGTGRFPMS
jgi:arginyl-tRNA--protein-N-Asp/Glu arginylyltransferase